MRGASGGADRAHRAELQPRVPCRMESSDGNLGTRSPCALRTAVRGELQPGRRAHPTIPLSAEKCPRHQRERCDNGGDHEHDVGLALYLRPGRI